MLRKAVWFAIPAAVGALVASQWQDIVRYLKIKQLSQGKGHPENVPVAGRTAYPQHSTAGDDDRGAAGRSAGGSTARDRTGVDPQEPIDDRSPDLQRG
jgi:hypothetical protein